MQSTNKIKIVYVIPTLDYGGAERQLLELCGHIDRDVFDPTIVLLDDRDRLLRGQYKNTSNPKIIKLKHRGKYNLLKFFELRRLFKQLNPHIVHTYLPAANFWGCLSARLFNKTKVVASSRGLHHSVLNKWYLMNFLSLNFLADFVIVNSKTVENNCVDFLKVNRDKIAKITNGVSFNKSYLREPPDNTNSEFGTFDGDIPVISSIGRLDKLKGFDFLVDAAGILVERGVKATFLIVGTGPLEKNLKSKVKKLALNNVIRFVSEVKNAEKIFSITDIFVLPTLSEGCSNVILEAMSAGLVIVTTAIPANEELIENNRTGLLVAPEDVKELANAIHKLIDSPSLSKKMGKNAKETSKSLFSVEKMTSQYEEFYRKITRKVDA